MQYLQAKTKMPGMIGMNKIVYGKVTPEMVKDKFLSQFN